MNYIENQNGISTSQSTRENTHIIQKNSRSGIQQYFNNGLGKVKIEHKIIGDIIRIYHSIQVCSLVINDKIFDQHHGEYASHYKMIGMVKSNGKVVRVEAKMGEFYMYLYCNDKLVAKKFMLFG